MKTSSASGRDRPVDRATAWACLWTNVLTLPGLGSVAAGRAIGYAQAGTALAGFGLTLHGLFRIVRAWLDVGELPVGFTTSFWVSLVGVAMFAAAWLWALITSLGILRDARPHEGAPRPAANDHG
ncbi:MAG: hypothetical protein M5U12_10770 [Verrucomicrobia bacterium]|nr:hypothetical protein [Verrucomicrobiota bacterium]